MRELLLSLFFISNVIFASESNEVFLAKAAWNGDIKKVISLVENTDVDINILVRIPVFLKDEGASDNGIIDGGAPLKNRYITTTYRTPLMHASVAGHIQIIKYLLDNGADINALSTNNYTATMLSAYFLQPKSLKALLAYSPKLNFNSRQERISLYDRKEQTALTSVYENARRRDIYNYNQEEIKRRRKEIISLLIRNGEDPFVGRSGVNHFMSNLDYPESRKQLIKPILENLTNYFLSVKEVDVTRLEKSIKEIASFDRIDLVEKLKDLHPQVINWALFTVPSNTGMQKLFDLGAYANTQDQLGSIPLMRRDINTLQAVTLINNGSNINHKNSCGLTPLMYAASIKKADQYNYGYAIAKELINAGAQVNIHNVIDYFNDYGDSRGIEMTCMDYISDTFRPRKSVLGNIYPHVETPLMIAYTWRNRELVQLLIEKGAKINYTNLEERNVLLNGLENIFYEKASNKSLLTYLIKNGAASGKFKRLSLKKIKEIKKDLRDKERRIENIKFLNKLKVLIDKR